ncbi:iron permease [Punctularia strigosozonata HHB-11173 SS5]|uniref:iron permease n=1 Tax=Punctularia strigosozonata (strain HHB-11173) TaxID=741275 RepID=UPI0004416D4E|nr:iron permease [Punctularia strigosozonata HHB-11173 SS5]EIN09217.1 iron permease [Punctularia strigosozonata HHB-11173 SS5]
MSSKDLLPVSEAEVPGAPTSRSRGAAFWMSFVATLLVDILFALDLTAVGTVLPTIIEHLKGSDFIWAGSAYTVSSTAILPVVGGLASIFGRKPTMLSFLVFFFLGSGICAGSRNLNMFIAGRVIQGLGGGGALATTVIIYADLIPLAERGTFLGYQAVAWATACCIGPIVGGALASAGAWRYLFWINLPLSGIAGGIIALYLRVHTPRDSFTSKIVRMDWPGNIMFVGSTTSVLLALTWAGQQFRWASFHVLVPLCIGFAGIFAFFALERWVVREPTVPWYALSNRTSLSGYMGTFFHGMTSMAVIFYLPAYLQACKGDSAIRSGVNIMALAVAIPFTAIIMGVSVRVFKRYRPQNVFGWVFSIAGFGALSTLTENSAKSHYIGFQIIIGIGTGCIWIATQFPILAPLPQSNNAHALAFFTWTRFFAQSWAIVIGGSILQNRIHSQLPHEVLAQLPLSSTSIYALIPLIHTFDVTTQAVIRHAFARSLQLLWRVMIGISGLGFLSCLFMREEKMRKDMDETWALKESRWRDEPARQE